MKRRDFLKIAAVLSVAPISGILSKPPKLKAVTPDDLVVEDSKTAGISILVPDNNICSITFGSPSCDSAGMRYIHPADDLLIAA